MAISFVASTGGITTTTSVTITVPTVAAGDFMIAAVGHQGTAGVTFTPPTGWALSYTGSDDGGQTIDVYTRTATSSDTGTTHTWTRSASGKWTVTLAAYRGLDAAPVGNQASSFSPGSTTIASQAAPNLTASVTGWRVDIVCTRSSTPPTSYTVPASMTKRREDFTTGTGASFTVIADSAADRTAGTWTGESYTTNTGATTGAWIVVSLALRPAGSPPMGPVTKVWSGSAWVVGAVKVWNGSAWVAGKVHTY